MGKRTFNQNIVIHNFVLEWVLHYILKATDLDLCGVPKMYQEREKKERKKQMTSHQDMIGYFINFTRCLYNSPEV